MTTSRFSSEVLLKAQGRVSGHIGVKAAIFDVDGVLTDGSLWYGDAGESFKPFHVLDGHGLKLLREAGITPLVVTGRDHPALRRRLADLGFAGEHATAGRAADACFGQAHKLAAAQALLLAHRVTWDEVAVIGDDWPDLPLIARAAFSSAPPGAHPDVIARVGHVTRAAGGHGAAREFCDVLIMAAGRYGELLEAALS